MKKPRNKTMFGTMLFFIGMGLWQLKNYFIQFIGVIVFIIGCSLLIRQLWEDKKFLKP